MDSSQSWKEIREVLQPYSLTNIIGYLPRGANWTSSFSQRADHRVTVCSYLCPPSENVLVFLGKERKQQTNKKYIFVLDLICF